MSSVPDARKLADYGVGANFTQLVGPFLKQKRKNIFVTQKALCSKGYAQSFISDFENGKRKADLNLIEAYAEVLQMDFYTLLIEVIEAQKSLLDEDIKKIMELSN